MSIPRDPVKYCNVYKQVGCSHVDGYLCDVDKCDIKVFMEIEPTNITIQDSYGRDIER